MKGEKYHLKTESGYTRFEFISEGKKGKIRKLIEFQKTNNPDVFNLAFGDFNEITQDFDDLAVTDNGDTEKVLLTVVNAVLTFYTKYPNVFVFACGSTEARTRLYRIGITKYFEEVKKDFYIYGQIGDNFVEFEIGKTYEGFLVQKKLL